MAQVDPENDTIRRWVIHHYRFDPARRERRNVVVAAYDNDAEFRVELERHDANLRREIAAGTRSPQEHVGGVTLEPGHREAAARGHNVRRAIEHGANPKKILDTGPLPNSMAVLTFTKDDPEPEDGSDPGAATRESAG